jgi:uncharacterized membrane protein YfcA
LTLSAGSLVGAYIASKMAVKKGVEFVKWIIVIVILITTGEMFGLYSFREIAALFAGR